MSALILIRGGGDLASGVALRLHRAGLKVLISELPQPLAVRRSVSFAEAVYEVRVTVEGVTACLVDREPPPGMIQIPEALEAGEIPVLVDPDASILTDPQFSIPIVIDGRLTKLDPSPLPVDVPLHIGLGPGFHAGRNCQAVIETRRSHTLGRVYWDGTAQSDSGLPDGDARRVLRAPITGTLIAHKHIGEHCEEHETILEILPEGGQYGLQGKEGLLDEELSQKVHSPFKGVLRGLIHPGLRVKEGLKIGDIDPRDDPEMCKLVSDKALAVGGGVLEALLSQPEIRAILW